MNQDLPDDPELSLEDNLHGIKASTDSKSLRIIVENDVDLPELFRKAYHTDIVCSKILAHLEAHLYFQVVDELIWTKNQL
jgi:hypothetical protein